MADDLGTGLLVIGILWVFGAGIARWLGLHARDGVAFVVWAYLLGALGGGVLAFAWLSLLPSAGTWFLAGLTAAGIGLAATAPAPRDAPPPRRRWSVEHLLAGIVGALALLPVLAHIVESRHTPVVLSDEGNIWAMHAKILYARGPCTAAYGDDVRNLAAGADYPLLDPLLQVLAFGAVGGIAEHANRVAVQVFAVILLLATAAGAAVWVRPIVAAIFTLLLAQHGEIELAARTACADAMLGTGIVASVDATLRAKRTGQARWLRAATCGAAFCALTKNEGLVAAAAVAILLAVLVARRPTLRPHWPWLGAPVVAVTAQYAFNAWHGLANYLFAMDSAETHSLWERAGITAAYLATAIVDPERSRLLLAAFLLGAVLCGRRLARPALAPLFVVACSTAALFVVYLATPQPLALQLRESAARVLFQLYGVAALGLAIVIAHAWPRLRRSTSDPGSQFQF